jgi:tetratricopeptide (TPR) repeat protein
MESREMSCSRCNKDTPHTFRYHITKTKHYSVVSVGSGKKEITVVCHVCLLETSVEKKDSKELVKQYDNEIAVGEANELLDKEKYSKAERKLQKVLNKDPEFPQALYSISKCLISQARYDEAEYQIRILENKFPDIPEIKQLRDSLPPKLGTVEPKQAEAKPSETAKPKPTLPKGSTPKPEAKPAETAKPKPTLPKGSTPKPAVISSEVNSSGEELEKSKRRLEEAERELEEKKLEKSKRRLEEAERELEEKKKKEEKSRKNKDIEKQIALNEEKIRKIEEESKRLDEED